MSRTACVVRVSAIIALTVCMASAQSAAPKIGDQVGDLGFVDSRFLPRRLSDFKDAKAIVVVFTGKSCPIVKRYLPRLAALDRTLRESGVRFLGVNPVDGDTVLDVAAQAMEYDVAFQVGKDEGGAMARALGVTRLAEVVVLDGTRRLRYRGHVDGQYRLGGASPAVGREDLREAITAVVAGRDVEVSETAVDGCAIAAPESRPTAPVTFHRDVVPVLKRNCVSCHSSGGDAPFPLTSYLDAKTNGGMLREVVHGRRMPPWLAYGDTSAFANAPTITDAERKILEDWVSAGMAEGTAEASAESRPTPPLRWKIGEPDLVLRSPEAVRIPAEGFVTSQTVILPHMFDVDTWVNGIQILADNAKVMHHAILVVVRPNEMPTPDGLLATQVPGGQPLLLADDTAVLIPRGTVLALSLHYVTTGKVERDQLSVGLRFPKVPVKHRLRYHLVVNENFEIPPGDPAFAVAAEKPLPTDARLMWLFPHMHLRGRDMSFTATLPDGTSESLLSVPSFSFDWQATYYYKPSGHPLPKGTVISCRARFDNSPFNPFNPDPKAKVHHGYDVTSEMMYAFVGYLDPAESLNVLVDPKTGRGK